LERSKRFFVEVEPQSDEVGGSTSTKRSLQKDLYKKTSTNTKPLQKRRFDLSKV
jgi:hypothetical protein